MSTTPQGSTTYQDDTSLTPTKTSTTITVTEQDYIVLDSDSDCRRTNEAFDLPRPKKFKSTTTIISNGSTTTTTNMPTNGNGTNPVDAMEHTNGAMSHNGVCMSISFLRFDDRSRRRGFTQRVLLREKPHNRKGDGLLSNNFAWRSLVR